MSSDEKVAGALTGAQAMVHTLADSGVEICFANPGTSEMHFVGALDRTPRVRGVLCLFEGVATGAADGWGRMTGRPAATLLHLGPGLANGLANLHNARRAHTPIVNVIGDHAAHHKHLDPPLESDLDALAATVSSWVHRPASVAEAGPDAAAAVAASMSPAAVEQQPTDRRRTGTSGSVATLLVPADVSWSPGGRTAAPVPNVPRRAVSEEVLGQVQAALCSGESCALLGRGGAERGRPAGGQPHRHRYGRPAVRTDMAGASAPRCRRPRRRTPQLPR